MKSLTFLEYSFVFEPDNSPWQTSFDFERDLADFMAAHSLEANIIDTSGGNSRRVIYLQPLDKIDATRQANDAPQQTQPQLAINRILRVIPKITK